MSELPESPGTLWDTVGDIYIYILNIMDSVLSERVKRSMLSVLPSVHTAMQVISMEM